MKTCATPGCDSLCEGYTDHCGTHNRLMRKLVKSANDRAMKFVNRKEIKKVSDKQAKKNALYSKQRKEHLAKFPFCQLKLQGCEKVATEIHHSQGRGESTNKAESFMSACHNCHSLLHDKMSAKEARELGLKK